MPPVWKIPGVYEFPTMDMLLISYGSAMHLVPLLAPFAEVKSAFDPMKIGTWGCSTERSSKPQPGGATAPAPPSVVTETAWLTMLVRACESWICKVTAYVPTVPNACCAVSVDDNDVSHTPSPSQSQRACNVAVGSESEEEDASDRKSVV